MAYRLRDISERESFILCDSSITCLGHSRAFDFLSNSLGYNDLDVVVVQKDIHILNKVTSFMKKFHINVIPEVKKELQEFVYKIERRKAEFDAHKKSVIMSRKNHNFKFISEFEAIETGEEAMFNEFYDAAARFLAQVNTSVYVPSNPKAHKLCSDLVCLIEEYGHCRKPNKYVDAECSNGKKNRYTDEKIIATGLYRSFFESKPTAIVTGDEDFFDIFHNGVRYVFSDDVPFNSFFLEHFIFFPVNLYWGNYGSLDLTTQWDLIGGTKTSPVFNLARNPYKNSEAKHKLDEIMRTLMHTIKNSS